MKIINKLKYIYFYTQLNKLINKIGYDIFETNYFKFDTRIFYDGIKVNYKGKNIIYYFFKYNFKIKINNDELYSSFISFDNIFWKIIKELKEFYEQELKEFEQEQNELKKIYLKKIN